MDNDDNDTNRDDNDVDEGSHTSSSYLSLDDDESPGDDGSSPLLLQRSVVVEDNDDAGSQVTFDTVDLYNNKEKGHQRGQGSRRGIIDCHN